MGRLSTVDLLVITSLDQLIFILKILLNFFAKQATLVRRPTVKTLPFQLGFNDLANQPFNVKMLQTRSPVKY